MPKTKTCPATALRATPAQKVSKRMLKENPLFAVPPKTCISCLQSTHDYEKQSDKVSFLRWPKQNFSKNLNAWTPSGTECGPCRDIRVRFWTEDAEPLKELRRANEKLENDFMEKREDRIKGTRKFVGQEKTSANTLVEETRSKVMESFETGVFTELDAFMVQRGMKPKKYSTRKEKEAAILKRYPTSGLEFGKGEAGCYGVFQKDSCPGDYRYRRAVKTETSLRKTREHEHDDVATEDFRNACGEGDDGSVGSENEAAADEEEPDQGEEPSDESDVDGAAPSVANASSAHSARSVAPLEPVSRSSVKRSSTQSTMSRSGKRSSAAPRPPPPPSDPDSDGGEEEGDDDDAEKEDGGVSAVDKKAVVKMTAAERLKAKAKSFLEKVKTEHTVEMTWNSSVRVRKHNLMMEQLTLTGNKLGLIVGDLEAGELSEQLFTTSKLLEERRKFVRGLKESPCEQLERDLDKNTYQMIRTTPLRLRSEMLASACFTVLKGDVDSWGVSARVARCLPIAEVNTALLLDNIGTFPATTRLSPDDTDMVAKCQKIIISTFIEKVCKTITQQEFCAVVRDSLDRVSWRVPSLREFRDKDSSAMQELHESGFTTQHVIDLEAMRVFAHVLGGQKCQGSFRAEAAAVLKSKNIMSSHLSAAVRVKGRSGQNHAKKAWDMLLEVWPDGEPNEGSLDEQCVQYVDKMTEIVLKNERIRGWRDGAYLRLFC